MFRKIGMLLLLTAGFFVATAHAFTLRHTVANGSRIGVVAYFGDKALFRRLGNNEEESTAFYQRLPKWSMNAFLTTTVANELYNHDRQYKVFPFYRNSTKKLADMRVMHHGRLTPAYQASVYPLIRDKKLDLLVLVVPHNAYLGRGLHVGSSWRWTRGYGLFNQTRDFVRSKAGSMVFAAYRIYLVDAYNYRVLARVSGDLKVSTPELNIAWQKDSRQAGANELATIKRTLRQYLPTALARTVSQTGLTG